METMLTIPADSIPVLISLDYASSGSAVEIDNGIRDTIKGIRTSILAMGLGLAKIKAEGLYLDLGFEHMAHYIQQLSDDSKMDQSSIFNWLYIGEAYIKYRNDLEQVGFTDSDGPTKLPYLKRALEKNQKEEVFSNIKNMSLRDFVSFAKAGEDPAIPTLSAGDAGDKYEVTVRGNTIYVDGKLAIIISKKLERRTSSYFKKVLRIACEALEEGEVLQPVRLHNRREARRFADAAELLIERLRAKKRT